MKKSKLTPVDKTKLLSLYETRYAQFGHSHKTVGWGTKEDQLLRFQMLCRGFSIEKKRIMDVGCGLGDFVRFLDDEYGTDYSYIGVDISETLISEAKKAFLGKNREFYSADFLEMEFPDVDLVFMSGALSYRVADNIECTKSFLQRAFNSANEGVAANFLSTYVDWQEEKNFHYQPEDLFGFCKGLTNWVSLFHDYPLWEFTLQLRRCPIVAARGNDENSR